MLVSVDSGGVGSSRHRQSQSFCCSSTTAAAGMAQVNLSATSYIIVACKTIIIINK